MNFCRLSDNQDLRTFGYQDNTIDHSTYFTPIFWQFKKKWAAELEQYIAKPMIIEKQQKNTEPLPSPTNKSSSKVL